jgi:hypothetical protein
MKSYPNFFLKIFPSCNLSLCLNEKKMKRKFDEKECVLCNGEDYLIVDTKHLALMKACQSSDKNVAYCATAHESKDDKFLHQPFPFSFPDINRFAHFVNNNRMPNGEVDFRSWKQALDFLNASSRLTERLYDMREMFTDPLSMFSSWVTYRTSFRVNDIPKSIYWEYVPQYWHFLEAHGKNIHFSEPKSLICTEIPNELLDLLSDEILLGGCSAMPNASLLQFMPVKIYMLDCPSRDAHFIRIFELLTHLDYIFVSDCASKILAIAPRKNGWHNVQISYSSSINPKDFLLIEMRTPYKQCCFTSKTTWHCTSSAKLCFDFGITCNGTAARKLQLQGLKMTAASKILAEFTRKTDAMLMYDYPIQFENQARDFQMVQLERQNLVVVHQPVPLYAKLNVCYHWPTYLQALNIYDASDPDDILLRNSYHVMFECRALIHHEKNWCLCTIDNHSSDRLAALSRHLAAQIPSYPVMLRDFSHLLVQFRDLDFDFENSFKIFVKIRGVTKQDFYWFADEVLESQKRH